MILPNISTQLNPLGNTRSNTQNLRRQRDDLNFLKRYMTRCHSSRPTARLIQTSVTKRMTTNEMPCGKKPVRRSWRRIDQAEREKESKPQSSTSMHWAKIKQCPTPWPR
jgi:hypothetical protein